MTICHLAKTSISKGQGKSAVAAAAYRSGEALYSASLGQVFDYSRKAGVSHSEILLPSGVEAPEWMRDRQQLWSRLEEAVTRKNGRLATEFTIALPAVLDSEQRLALARDYVQQLADRYGVAADFSLHQPSREGDQRNFHVHVMLSSLKVN